MLRIGKLKPHTPDKAEIERLLAAAERALKDANMSRISSDGRLDLAYRAIMQTALVALLANGFRPSTGEPGHHQLLIQALPKTLGLPAERVRLLDAFRAARNRSDYDGVPVSHAVARECVEEARLLLEGLRAWLSINRPELV